MRWLEEAEGAEAVWLVVGADGAVRPDVLRAAIAQAPEQVAVASVMWANNEVGTVQPVSELAAVAHEYGVPFHTDAVQAAAQLPVDFAASGADALTVTGHKLGGPVGVGALILARGAAPVPVLHGGGQERDIRSGTLDTPAIRAFAVAAAVCAEQRADEAERLAALRDELVRQVLAAVPDAVLNGPPPGPDRLPGNAHFSFPGCEGDALLMLLDANGIACSTGSACTAGVAEPSHVLLAMGADDFRARGSLRFSLGHTSTKRDVDALGLVIREVVDRARRARPLIARPAGADGPPAARYYGGDHSGRRGVPGGSSPPGNRVVPPGQQGRPPWVTWRDEWSSSSRGDVRRSGLRDGRGSCGGRGSRGDRRPPGAVVEPVVVPDRGPRLLHARGREGRAAGRRRHRHPVLRVGHGRALPP